MLLLLGMGKVFRSVFFSAVGESLPLLLMCQTREGVRVFRIYQ